jgi:ribosomal protein L37AE/L43A
MKPGKPLQRRAPLRAAAPAKAEVKIPNARKCKVCGDLFRPSRGLQTWCTPECGAVLAGRLVAKKEAKAKAEEKRQDRERLAALKPRQHWLKKAEEAVNRYVRARDYHLGCVSCDLPATWDGQWHASHFRSVAAASSVRFCLWNIHKACWICNKHFSGRIDAYTPSIVVRIGQQRVDWLRAQNQRADYQREYLQRLARVFNRKAARQERRNARR